mmetsp:Transcript_13021/g.14329  ORF Transcript_13021/g.14329 Transcript_13021/m.14329 type:complete len:87 (-) Transcript_13021:800-1060(-)
MIQFFVKTLGGETIPLDVDSRTTIFDVRIMIVRKTLGRVRPTVMVFAGLPLDDEKTIGDYNIHKGSTAHVLTVIARFLFNRPAYGK